MTTFKFKLSRWPDRAPADWPLLEVAARLGAPALNFATIDTGACISITPNSFINGISVIPTPVSLTTANGQPIECKGQASVEIVIPSLRRSFFWTLVIAEVVQTLLGLDFLSHFDLTVDC